MSKAAYRKLDIASEYLTLATELYYLKRYFPALSLAGMAEEIFEAVINARNDGKIPDDGQWPRASRHYPEPISKQIVGIVQMLDKKQGVPTRSNKAIHKLLYDAKNSAKHATLKDGDYNLEVVVDAELQAYAMLGRAVQNYLALRYEPTGAVLKFYRQYLAGRKSTHHDGESI
jgi:hypothetical protein